MVIKKTSIHGFDILVFANEDIGRQILALKAFEERDTNFLRKLIKPDWVCFDIGANIGYYTLFFSLLAPLGSVYAFEPVPQTYDLLQKNVALNNLKNVFVHKIALSKKDGKQNFVIAEDSAFSSFFSTERVGIKELIPIQCQSLDSYAAEYHIPRINFIKMDVEGAEKWILEGASRVLIDIKPDVFMIELADLNVRAYSGSIEDVLTLMAQSAYKPYIVDFGNEDTLVPFQQEHYNRIQNVYFVRNVKELDL